MPASSYWAHDKGDKLKHKTVRALAGVSVTVMALAAFGSDPGHAQAPAPTISGNVEGLLVVGDCDSIALVNQVETPAVVSVDSGNDGDVDGAPFTLGPNSAGSDFNQANIERPDVENDRFSVTANGRNGKVVANFASCASDTTATTGRTTPTTQASASTRSSRPRSTGTSRRSTDRAQQNPSGQMESLPRTGSRTQTLTTIGLMLMISGGLMCLWSRQECELY